MDQFWTLSAASGGICSFLLALLLAPRAAKYYRRRGWVDHPGGRKRQVTSVPFGGGLVVLLASATPVFVGMVFTGAAVFWSLEIPDSLKNHIDGAHSKIPELGAMFAGAGLLAWMGRRDDRKPMNVAPRFLVQTVVAALVAWTGPRATVFVETEWIQFFVTVVWIVFVVNACNFIDNMDGLLAGTTTWVSLGLGVTAMFDGHYFIMILGAVMAGAAAGVWRYNRQPARLYLGDEGSMSIGFLLAVACLAATFQPVAGSWAGSFSVVLMPVFLLVVPILDGVFVTIRRLLRRSSPFSGGLDHLSHELERRGLGRNGAVACLHAAGLFGLVATCLIHGTETRHVLAALFFAVAGAERVISVLREAGAGRLLSETIDP